MEKEDRWYADWRDAFIDQGMSPKLATKLAEDCVTWLTNNPKMTWLDIFDAVHLDYETSKEDNT